MKLDTLYTVIGYDMKRLIVTGPKADKTYFVKWQDIELIKSELIVNQVSSSGSIELLALAKSIRRLAASIPAKPSN